ncbi:HNH endonuclease domain-containing protein [Salinivirga cyanobacteriivorans]
MNPQIFANINKIIQRDSKTSTYKFALLRGTIEIIQDNSPYIISKSDVVEIPLGLLVEKWLIYYYPLFESNTKIPQIYKNSKLAFEEEFKTFIIHYYIQNGGFSAFYNDLRNQFLPTDLSGNFFQLVKKIRHTITNMPMRYIGRSVNDTYYSIFKFQNKRPNFLGKPANTKTLIEQLGFFTIPREYYEAFALMGSFLTGSNSILYNWAEFSVNASNGALKKEMVLNHIYKAPTTERNIQLSKKLFERLQANKNLFCVWTGSRIQNYHIDHLIPFSAWHNNDLWNLLPTKMSINLHKSDKIPAISLVEKQQDLIVDYWEKIAYEDQFNRELSIALAGYHTDNIKKHAIEQFKTSCNYLIQTKGMEEWQPN